jgi:hypothetical protein
MKILYMGTNEQAEYHEINFLLEEGHTVFSVGEQLLPASVPESRKISSYKPSDELTELFWKLHPNYAPGKLIKLSKPFLQEFDLVVMSDYPEYLSLNHKEIFQLKKRALWVWRKRPKNTPVIYRAVIKLKSKGLKVLELPIAARYKVTECKELWVKTLKSFSK